MISLTSLTNRDCTIIQTENTYNYKNRWGYFSATIFGSQNGKGQYHKNAYTKKKLQAMCDKLGFKVIKLKDYRWKKDRDYMINLIAKKL